MKITREATMQVREEAKRKIDPATLRQWAAHPASNGFVPIYPQTLKILADQLIAARSECDQLRALITELRIYVLNSIGFPDEFRKYLLDRIDAAANPHEEVNHAST